MQKMIDRAKRRNVRKFLRGKKFLLRGIGGHSQGNQPSAIRTMTGSLFSFVSTSPKAGGSSALCGYVRRGRLATVAGTPEFFDLFERPILCFWNQKIGEQPCSDGQKAIKPEGRGGADGLEQR